MLVLLLSRSHGHTIDAWDSTGTYFAGLERKRTKSSRRMEGVERRRKTVLRALQPRQYRWLRRVDLPA